MMKLFDGHTHLCLSDDDIPKYAFGWITPFLMKSDKRANFVAKFLSNIIPFTSKDGLDRLAKILKENRLDSKTRIKEYFQHFSTCNVLLMDLEGSMNAGKTKRSYEDQIIEAINFKKLFDIKIFLFINPNRPNMIELVEKYYEDIDGYKYYPSLTRNIDNLITRNILTKYPKNNVIIHTTSTSPIYNKKLDKKYCGEQCHPKFTVPLLNLYPNINFIFAHAGGEQWLMDCVSICSKYKNAYIDISYTFGDKKLHPKLERIFEIIPNKILFGTDSYLIDIDNFLDIKNKEKMIENNYRIF